MEKLKALKDKIGEHQKHLEELDKHVYILPCISAGYVWKLMWDCAARSRWPARLRSSRWVRQGW